MKVLITGASGFIGSHVADILLDRGYEVRAIVRKSSNLRWLENKNVEYSYASLDNKDELKEAVSGVDYVIHVAGLVAARTYDDFLKANRDATRNLLEACVEVNPNIKKFLHVSSQTVQGPSKSLEEPAKETDPCKPLTRYGKSKKEAEDVVNSFKDNLPISIIRPSAVYGQRDTATLDIFKAISKGVVSYIGFNKKYVSIVHSSDLARAIVDATESENTIGKTYFISSEKPYTWYEINPIIKEALNKKFALNIKLPHFLVLIVAHISEFFGKFSAKPPVFDSEKGIDFIQDYWTCSVDAAKKDFGYEQKMSLEQGMKETADWYKEHKWL